MLKNEGYLIYDSKIFDAMLLKCHMNLHYNKRTMPFEADITVLGGSDGCL